MRWCGPEVEVEGIVSVKTGGCPEDCHFCSQSGLFDLAGAGPGWTSPRWSRRPGETAATGATEFCIVAAVRGPDERLMAQVREGVAAIRAEVDIQIAASLGMLTQEQVDELVAMGVHRYNHNLETAPLLLPAGRHHAHLGGALGHPARWSARPAWRCAAAASSAWARRSSSAPSSPPSSPRSQPDEVPLNFLNPRPGTPFGDLPVVDARDALRAIAAFRLALPRTILRFAGGREITLGDLGTSDGVLGGINAVIVGNYLTTLGRPADQDLSMLADLKMPIKTLAKNL